MNVVFLKTKDTGLRIVVPNGFSRFHDTICETHISIFRLGLKQRVRLPCRIQVLQECDFAWEGPCCGRTSVFGPPCVRRRMLISTHHMCFRDCFGLEVLSQHHSAYAIFLSKVGLSPDGIYGCWSRGRLSGKLKTGYTMRQVSRRHSSLLFMRQKKYELS